MKELLFIINPYAGQQKGRRLLSDILNIYNRAGCTVLTHVTSGQGDAEKTCLRYADRVDRIICCGGDGTFNETVSGVIKSGRNIPIGYIPAGSTNDFAAGLHLSHDLLEAAKDSIEGKETALDIGLFGSRIFSYVASFGIFARTSYTTPQSLKNVLGHAAYVLGGIQELSQIRSYPLRFTLSDGRVIEDKFLFGAVSNSVSVGGTLTLSEDLVDMADGKLELLLIREPKDLFELRDCVRALQQKTYDSAMITLLSTDAVKVSAPEEMEWTIDGEQEPGHAEIDIRCLHRAIRVITK